MYFKLDYFVFSCQSGRQHALGSPRMNTVGHLLMILHLGNLSIEQDCLHHRLN